MKTRYYICFIFFLVCLSTNVYSQSNEFTPPESYIAYRCNDSLEIDGKPTETAWGKALWTKSFIDIEGIKKPKYHTQVKMLWDDKYFYVFAKMEEPHIWADLTKHDAIIFHNNDFEVFIDPEGDAHNYYELEINALGTTWDLFLTQPYRVKDNVVQNNWEILGLKSGVHIEGTLNNPKDIDKYWTVELAIPWEAFKTSYFHKIVPKDKFWRVNFSRVNWDYQLENGKYQRKKDKKGKLLHEYNWVWSAQRVINMHQPEKWGYVYFSSKPIGEKDTFTIPNDEEIKWQLFELYRKQKEHNHKYNKWSISLKKLDKNSYSIKGKEVTFNLENHSQGFNIWTKSPFSGKTYLIKENGRLTIINAKTK